MCCFCLHLADFNVLFFQKNKKILQFSFEKNNLLCKKREKKLVKSKNPSTSPRISNGPSLSDCNYFCDDW